MCEKQANLPIFVQNKAANMVDESGFKGLLSTRKSFAGTCTPLEYNTRYSAGMVFSKVLNSNIGFKELFKY